LLKPALHRMLSFTVLKICRQHSGMKERVSQHLESIADTRVCVSFTVVNTYTQA
jgi:hypothetical protein